MLIDWELRIFTAVRYCLWEVKIILQNVVVKKLLNGSLLFSHLVLNVLIFSFIPLYGFILTKTDVLKKLKTKWWERWLPSGSHRIIASMKKSPKTVRFTVFFIKENKPLVPVFFFFSPSPVFLRSLKQATKTIENTTGDTEMQVS